MKLSIYIKKLIRDYFIIFACVVICLTILNQLFSPDSVFELSDIFVIMILSLAGDLPSLILYSSKEISKKETRVRLIIHFIVLEASILILANAMNWISGLQNTALCALQIAGIYLLVHYLAWQDHKKIAFKMNEKLKDLKKELEEN